MLPVFTLKYTKFLDYISLSVCPNFVSAGSSPPREGIVFGVNVRFVRNAV